MPSDSAITSLILEIFRLNGTLIAEGDSLVAKLGLTSARWQVIGAMALSSAPLPVAHIARNMGLTRQAVQRLANDLEREGFLEFAPNPHHQRAKLAILTRRGKAAHQAAMKLQRPWGQALVRGLQEKEIEAATAILKTLRRRLDAEAEGERPHA